MTPTSGLNVLVWQQGTHQYVLLYDDEHRVEAMQAVGKWAADPELNFTWYGAAVLSQSIRRRTGT